MAYIGHRCACGHSDLQHRGAQTGGGCTARAGHPCQQPCGPVGEPQVIPTFNLHGQPIERVIAPGGGFPTLGGGHHLRTCDCESCQALYAEVVA
ncbi:hypothetical protein ACIPJK_07445 [Streptomyces roseus]|uniref:hypothetical protein n=1 Tax=Streptomyces roseus TaxID=66430 RepID=UPI0038251175